MPLLLGVAALPAPARASDGAPGDAAQIVVTGTRIHAPDVSASAPITTITAQDVQWAGTARVEDILNALPQVYPGQTSTLSNGATGIATADLRGLGPGRTLVLVNGRRMVPGDASSAAADINFIPAALIKRVDVLTGGASATYGADAVAGVVNFVMDTHFSGVRLNVTNSFYAHDNGNTTIRPLLDDAIGQGLSGYTYPKGLNADGRMFDTTLSFGSRFGDGLGHVTAYVGYRRADPVLQSQRDGSACTIQNEASLPAPFNPAQPQECGGSPYSANGNAIWFTQFGPTPGTLGQDSQGRGTLTSVFAGANPTQYNTAPQNYFQRPDERYTAGAFADYAVSQAFHPYVEAMFMDDHSLGQLAPSGDFGNTLTINCDNPMLSAQQQSQLCTATNKVVGYLGTYPLNNRAYTRLKPVAKALVTGLTTPALSNTAFFQLLRRNVEGGPRVNDISHTSFRTVLGARGELSPAWAYDASFQYGRTDYREDFTNDVSKSRVANALDVISVGGVPTCRIKALGIDPACAPYDVFSGNRPSAASLAYISATGDKHGASTQSVASAQLTGDLGAYGVKSPWASRGATVALGGEWRRETLHMDANAELATGDLAGGAQTPPISGAYDVAEFISEANVPLVDRRLTFNGALRLSHYALSGGQSYDTTTWRLGLDASPTDGISFRGSINRAARAPNLQELYSSQYVGPDGVSDPCAGKILTGADTTCLAQGLSIGQYVVPNPAGFYNGLRGGAPSLRPEIATTKTLGVVLAPPEFPGFSLSADWFDIKVKNAIEAFGASAILSACSGGNRAACAMVHRDAGGSLWLTSDGYVADLRTNIGSVETRGFDFTAAYATRIAHGTLSLEMVSTLLDKSVTRNGLSAAYDCAGYYGPTCGTPSPHWRHQARATFAGPNRWTASLQWRYVGPVAIEYLSASPTLAGHAYSFGSHIAGQSYFDLAVSKGLGRHLLLRVGANNLFDKDPPLLSSGGADYGASGCAPVVCNGNTYPGTYDALGRYIYTGVTLEF